MNPRRDTKILFISTSFEDESLINASEYNPKGVKTDILSHYPLGFAYLQSYLGVHGYRSDNLFLNNCSEEDGLDIILKKIEVFEPAIIGLQIFTNNRGSSFRLLEYLHQHCPHIKLFIGGIHASIMYDQIIRKYPFVIAVLGEGEISTLNLIEELGKKNIDLASIRGIAYYNGKEIVRNPDQDLIDDLDQLPFPRHKDFFQDNDRNTGCLLTSRGCPFSCSFCCLDAISRRRARLRSAENVVDEIEEMILTVPQIKRIWIQDDNFLIDNDRAIKICDEIIRRGIKMHFVCSARVKPITQELVNKLEEAGFRKVLFGLESGDEGILRSCRKNITQKDAEQALRYFLPTKIIAGFFIIVGLPGENEETVRETIRFIKRLQRIRYFYTNEISILAVYPGTEVYQIAKRGGMIDDDYWLTDKPTPLYTLEHSQTELFSYKKMILDNISLDSFFIPSGFFAQFTMLPYIIRYLYQDHRAIVPMLSRGIKNILPPKGFEIAKSLYNYIKHKK